MLKLRRSILRRRRRTQVRAGLLSFLLSAGIITALLTTVDIEPVYEDFSEELNYLINNLDRFQLHSFIWLANSIVIIALAPYLLIAFLPVSRNTPYLVGFLILATGFLYLMSTIHNFTIIQLLQDYQAGGEETARQIISLQVLSTLHLKQNIQMICYTLAGLSAFFLGIFMILNRSVPTYLGILAVPAGVIYGLYGWIDLSSIIFTSGRLLFILSVLILSGHLLFFGIKK